MPHVSFRVTDNEKDWMESYAKVRGLSLSDSVKEVFFEKLEDEYDLHLLKEYEQENAKEPVEYYTLDEAKRILELE